VCPICRVFDALGLIMRYGFPGCSLPNGVAWELAAASPVVHGAGGIPYWVPGWVS
jgi:hypothetical protein